MINIFKRREPDPIVTIRNLTKLIKDAKNLRRGDLKLKILYYLLILLAGFMLSALSVHVYAGKDLFQALLTFTTYIIWLEISSLIYVVDTVLIELVSLRRLKLIAEQRDNQSILSLAEEGVLDDLDLSNLSSNIETRARNHKIKIFILLSFSIILVILTGVSLLFS